MNTGAKHTLRVHTDEGGVRRGERLAHTYTLPSATGKFWLLVDWLYFFNLVSFYFRSLIRSCSVRALISTFALMRHSHVLARVFWSCECTCMCLHLNGWLAGWWAPQTEKQLHGHNESIIFSLFIFFLFKSFSLLSLSIPLVVYCSCRRLSSQLFLIILYYYFFFLC